MVSNETETDKHLHRCCVKSCKKKRVFEDVKAALERTPNIDITAYNKYESRKEKELKVPTLP